MTEGEKMVWAACYAEAIASRRSQMEAMEEACYQVAHLRDSRKRFEHWSHSNHVEMVAEMLDPLDPPVFAFASDGTTLPVVSDGTALPVTTHQCSARAVHPFKRPIELSEDRCVETFRSMIAPGRLVPSDLPPGWTLTPAARLFCPWHSRP
jgi:hypothetical protein